MLPSSGHTYSTHLTAIMITHSPLSQVHCSRKCQQASCLLHAHSYRTPVVRAGVGKSFRLENIASVWPLFKQGVSHQEHSCYKDLISCILLNFSACESLHCLNNFNNQMMNSKYVLTHWNVQQNTWIVKIILMTLTRPDMPIMLPMFLRKLEREQSHIDCPVSW